MNQDIRGHISLIQKFQQFFSAIYKFSTVFKYLIAIANLACNIFSWVVRSIELATTEFALLT